MATTTTKGYPYPEGTDPVDVPGDIQALAEAVDDSPGIESLTSTEIAGLSAGAKWAGRVVWNSTAGKLQVSNGSTFSDVDTSVALSSSTPQALGTAGAGTSSDASRADHRHAMPSASDVGAIANALVDVRGDLVAASGDNTPVRLAAGSNGQMLMADSSATAGLRYVDPPTNRNLIINGAMTVAQRGTSVTGITSAGYRTADRFQTPLGSFGTWTQTQENDAPTGSGFRQSLKLTCTTAETATNGLRFFGVNQQIEGQNLQHVRKGTIDAQQLTVSFWVKSNVTGTYVVNFRDFDNSRSVSATYTISSSATWERKVITFPADTTGAFDNDNAASLEMTFWLAAGTDFTSGTLNTTWASTTNANRAVGQTNLAAATNNYWQVTGVQLEVGPVATPFEFEPYEATLRKCQRYYQKSYKADSYAGNVDTDGNISWNAASTTADRNYTTVVFPTQMRAAPTVTLYSPITGASGKIYNALTSAADKNGSTAYINQNGFAMYVGPTTGANATGDLLIAHYIAAVEL